MMWETNHAPAIPPNCVRRKHDPDYLDLDSEWQVVLLYTEQRILPLLFCFRGELNHLNFNNESDRVSSEAQLFY